MSSKSTVELLNEYIEQNMQRDSVTGLYPDEQIKKLNEYFHSLPDVKLYHGSPRGDIDELRVGFSGKSGVLNEIYASPEESFTYAFAIHNHEEKSFIDTSKHSMDFCVNNVDAVRQDNKGCYIYEITTPHTEFTINPNSKFGAFEVTCPHNVQIKPPVYKDNLLGRMVGKWNFYHPTADNFYSGILATGAKMKGEISPEEFNTLRAIYLTSEKQKISSDEFLNGTFQYNFTFDRDKIEQQYQKLVDCSKMVISAQKAAKETSGDVEEIQFKNRRSLKKIAKNSGLSFNTPESQEAVAFLYSPEIYGKPKDFLACFPDMSYETKREMFNQLHKIEREANKPSSEQEQENQPQSNTARKTNYGLVASQTAQMRGYGC